MKKVLVFAFAVSLSFVFIFPSFAHSGRTDSNGGHYDHSTGIYHYHYDFTHPATSASQESTCSISQEESDPYKYLPKDTTTDPVFDFKEEYTNISKVPSTTSNEKDVSWGTIGVGFLFLLVLFLVRVSIYLICDRISKRNAKKQEQMNELMKKYSFYSNSFLDENGKPKSVEQLLKERQQREEREKIRQLTEELQRNKEHHEQQERKTHKRIQSGYFLVKDTESENVSSSDSDKKKEKESTEHKEQNVIYIIRSSKDDWE